MEYEMANFNDPEDIVAATQRSIITAMQGVLKGLRKDVPQPGLTWDQLDEFMERFKNKKPTIITQKEAQ